MKSEGANRPDWTLVKRACRIWAEDDATIGQPDHEGTGQAFRRIFRIPVPAALETWDDDESVYKRLPAGLVARESRPGCGEIASWPLLSHGDPVTVVLRSAPDEGASRLVYTSVVCWLKTPVPNVFAKLLRAEGVRTLSMNAFDYDGRGIVAGEVFETEDDDRPEHRITDRTVTWVEGHVLRDSEEALALLRAAEQFDEQAEKEGSQ